MTASGKTYSDGTYMSCPLDLGDECTCPQWTTECEPYQAEREAQDAEAER